MRLASLSAALLRLDSRRTRILVEPWKWIYDETARITKLAEDSEIRAFGFSDTGNSFVIATSSGLEIYCGKP
jgi:hypothetical protein